LAPFFNYSYFRNSAANSVDIGNIYANLIVVKWLQVHLIPISQSQ